MSEYINALADVSVGNYIPLMVISLILLIGGADKLLDATEDLAKKLGTSEFIIGLTVVALGTSLPEITPIKVSPDSALNLPERGSP